MGGLVVVRSVEEGRERNGDGRKHVFRCAAIPAGAAASKVCMEILLSRPDRGKLEHKLRCSKWCSDYYGSKPAAWHAAIEKLER